MRGSVIDPCACNYWKCPSFNPIRLVPVDVGERKVEVPPFLTAFIMQANKVYSRELIVFFAGRQVLGRNSKSLFFALVLLGGMKFIQLVEHIIIILGN